MSTSTTFQSRQQKLADFLAKADLDALALNPSPSLTYLTGLHFHLSERPVLAFLAPDRPLSLVLPELEAAKVNALPYPLQAFTYAEDPTTWASAIREAYRAAAPVNHRIGVEPRNLRYLELSYLEAAAPEARFFSAEGVIASLRMRKDEQEIAAMQQAVEIAEKALQATLPQIRVGTTEKEIATALAIELLRLGSDPRLPFYPIVSGGPNSANPHATPSDRPLQPGDLLVIDYGARVDGYLSDITRTFAIGEVSDEFAHIAEIVRAANRAGREAVQPGVSAASVDQAARNVIEEAGYGKFFIHRTGHGLGLEGHEEPYIRADNDLQLQAGMTFTIEPGIYLPGMGGVRIEDDVVVTPSGCRSLTGLPRELIHLP